MQTLRSIRTNLAILFLCTSTVTLAQVRFRSPQSGEIYREYTRSMNGQDYLQVPDPNIDTIRYPQVKPFIPAPPINIYIGDLSGAIRAEVMITYIGGHISTVGQKMRWNGNPWIDIPLLDTSNGIPSGHNGYNYLMLHNITMDIPLSQLYEGTNYFQGTSGTQADPRYSFGWGQWGWYAMMVRIYYGPSKPHATGVITSHTSGGLLTENPTISASVTSGSAQQIDFLAYYDDYDTDGDGRYLEYHNDYMMVDGQTQLYVKNHVGSATSAPWSVTWNTGWVPDQPAGQVKLIARIRDNNGIWYVTPEITQLSLVRTGTSIRLYKPLDTPERCWVKGDVGGGTQTIHFAIPSSDNLADASMARYYTRLWNGLNVASQDSGQSEYRHFNTWSDVKFGADHHYTFDARTLPISALQSGTNTWQWYNSVSLHHGIEVLWPGPALAVRYTGNYASPIPGMTTLESPPGGSTDQPTTLTLRWHPALAAASYDVQVSTDSLFGTMTSQFTSIADTSLEIGPLAGETRYFWRVRAVNQAGATSYTEAWNFNTTFAAAAVPSLLLPSNNAVDLPLDLTVRWHSAANAQRYHLQLGADSTFATLLVVNDSTIIDTVKALNGLTHDARYYWRVRSVNPVGASAFSPTWNFRTISGVPAGPPLSAPANGASGLPTVGLTFVWRNVVGATDYQFMLGKDSTFTTGMVKNDSMLVDSFRVVSGLSHATRYFWRVAARNTFGSGPFSSTWSFETIVAAPGVVSQIAPAHQAIIGADSVEFRWNQTIPAATRYWLVVSIDSTFGQFSVVDSALADTSTIFGPLSSGSTYYWKVRGANAGGWGAFSTVRSFSVLITSIRDTMGVPEAFALSQNYPNPFNPSTVIKYTIGGNRGQGIGISDVSLVVYDILGQVVAVLVNERQGPGNYEVRFDASGFSSGVYLYRLMAGSFIQSRKMLLVQ